MAREDRRSAQRVRAGWPVQLETAQGEMVNGRVSDISTSGLRVQAPIELATGTGVPLRVTLHSPMDASMAGSPAAARRACTCRWW